MYALRRLLSLSLVSFGIVAAVDAQDRSSIMQPPTPAVERGKVVERPIVASSTVRVISEDPQPASGPSVHTATSEDVLSSAGTYGDFSKYLQIFPGVVFNSDQSNDVLVRGGNPVENLYIVDGIEVPDINHITGEGTTGGFTSMIDTASIQNVDLLSGGYSAQYSERLSSVISIHTLSADTPKGVSNDAEVGYVGLGGHRLLSFGQRGSLLISAHRSLLNMFTKDVGLDGVPIYTNALASGSEILGSKDRVSYLSLSGSDSINILPSDTNTLESNTIQTQYRGWRTTNGFRWQHAFSQSNVGTLTLSDSEQKEIISQQDQLLDNSSGASTVTAKSPSFSPVYSENNYDASSILQYQLTADLSKHLVIDAGSQIKLNRVHYAVAQPVGQLSPFATASSRTDASSFSPQLALGQTGSWVEVTTQPLVGWSVTGGLRLQTFAGNGHASLTPRIRTSLRLGSHRSLYAAFGAYSQLPSYIYLESFPQNRLLSPIHAQHLIVGLELWKSQRAKITIEGYRKHYWDYPVASEYPQLSLANQVDTLGQEVVWLPLVSRGHGHDYGVEVGAETRLGKALVGQASIAYARALYDGTDGRYRPGNFDYPVVMNLATTWRPSHGYEASIRYEYSTGRPYTPFLMAASIAQDRGIYDLAKLNADRGPAYSRLDFQVTRVVRSFRRDLYLFGGLQNALDRRNFLGYEWLPRCAKYPQCIAANGAYTLVPQISRYPNFGARMFF